MQSLQEQTVEAAEIAAALNLSPAYFSRNVPIYIQHHGMPHRLPGRRRWSRPAIERWLANYGQATARRTPDLPAPVREERAALHLVYASEGGEARA